MTGTTVRVQGGTGQARGAADADRRRSASGAADYDDGMPKCANYVRKDGVVDRSTALANEQMSKMVALQAAALTSSQVKGEGSIMGKMIDVGLGVGSKRAERAERAGGSSERGGGSSSIKRSDSWGRRASSLLGLSGRKGKAAAAPESARAGGDGAPVKRSNSFMARARRSLGGSSSRGAGPSDARGPPDPDRLQKL